MNNVAISLGETICRLGVSLIGFGNARCYDSASMQALGYLLLAGMLLALLWTRMWSRT